MPVCHKCGKANAAEYQFCEGCGSRLAPPTATPPPRAPSTADGPPVCSRCNTVGEAGMCFCKMCGTPLGARNTEVMVSHEPEPAPAPPSLEPAAVIRCPSCGKSTPAGMAFCQHCGARQASAASPPVGTSTATASVSESAGRKTPPRMAPVPPRANGPTSGRVDPTATVKLDPPAAAAGSTARLEPARSEPVAIARVEVPARSASESSRMTPATGVRTPGPTRSEPRAVPVAGPPRGRVVVMRDGRDAETHVISTDTFDIGRSEGQLVIGGDPHLAARHVRFTTPPPGVAPAKVRPLDTVNGVFVRVQGGCDLVPGDVILVGRQLLRYEAVNAEERDPPTVLEHGVRLLGSEVLEAWGRLRQLTSAGTTRDLWHLSATEVVIGRRGDVVCDDSELAERHAVIRRGSGRPRLEDQGAATGTFVRLRGERELRGGEQLRLGELLLRFEAAGQGSA